jgi:predicted MFS family arabinose efflux permease
VPGGLSQQPERRNELGYFPDVLRSVYRFWRDLGYAVGALIAGVIGDLFGLAWSIAVVGMLTFVSGLIVAATMKKNNSHELNPPDETIL